MGKLSGGGADSGGSSSNYPGWVGYIEFDDETGEAIAADYSGLEVDVVVGLKFSKNYKFRGDWNSNMSSVIDGSSMFYGCSNLTSFTGDLSSLTNGQSMFADCFNLTSFNGDLSSLTSGSSMFSSCKLDKQSVIDIISCLKERNICTTPASLQIGFNKQIRNDGEILQLLGVSSLAGTVTLVGHGGGTWSINLQAN